MRLEAATVSLTALIAAGDQQHHALNNTPCACVYDHPYAPRGKLVTKCGRCKAIAAWNAAKGVTEVKSS